MRRGGPVSQMRDQQCAKAVPHQYVTWVLHEGRFQPMQPVGQDRTVPIVLLHQQRAGLTAHEMVLPVARAGTTVARYDERSDHAIHLRSSFSWIGK